MKNPSAGVRVALYCRCQREKGMVLEVLGRVVRVRTDQGVVRRVHRKQVYRIKAGISGKTADKQTRVAILRAGTGLAFICLGVLWIISAMRPTP